MATTVIANACIVGAMGGLMAGRFYGSAAPTDYTTIATAAAAIKNEFLEENSAQLTPLADEDNPEIAMLVQSIAFAALINQGSTSTTQSAYDGVAKQIVASAKQALVALQPHF
jgi:hypothetical protein